MKYPTLEKIKALQDKTQLIGDFLNWLGEKGYELAEYDKNDRLVPLNPRKEDLIAQFFRINQKKAEEERQALLKSIR